MHSCSELLLGSVDRLKQIQAFSSGLRVFQMARSQGTRIIQQLIQQHDLLFLGQGGVVLHEMHLREDFTHRSLMLLAVLTNI